MEGSVRGNHEGTTGDDGEGALVDVKGGSIEDGTARHERGASGAVAEVVRLGGDAPQQASGAPEGATAVGNDGDRMLERLGDEHGRKGI